MPITRSAKKALRQSLRRRAHNLFHKNRIKRVQRTIRKFLAAGKAREAQAQLPELYKYLDKAAKEKVIKPNTAARLKSRITRAVQKATKTS